MTTTTVVITQRVRLTQVLLGIMVTVYVSYSPKTRRNWRYSGGGAAAPASEE